MCSGGDGRKFDVCYNVQTVVDSKHKLIVDFEATNCASDGGKLSGMTERAKAVLDVETLTNLSDKGYYSGEDINKCEKNGITCLIAKKKPSGEKKPDGFNHADFIYDRERDVIICPCKQELLPKRKRKRKDGREYHVYLNVAACSMCQKKPLCTKSEYREISRLVGQDILDRVDERTRQNKDLYLKRREIVEHPFGTIKAVWGYKQFLCRTQPKVNAEMALTYTAYNLRRIFNIFAESGVKIASAFG